jgi:phospholipase C
MQGFLNNYARRNSQNPEIIMNCFTPMTLPVLSTLALNYCVCDHWFCSIPSQTLCNRSFVQAGTSSGYVDNEGGGRIFDLSNALNLDAPRQDHPPILEPANMEISVVQRTLAVGKWLMHASEKPVTELHKAALSETARKLGRLDLADQAQGATSVFDAEAVAIKLEAELWKRRHATTPIT